MKKVLIVLGILVLLLVIGATGGFFYVKKALPNVGPVVDVQVAHNDTALINRGRYLAEHVTGCVECHSQRDLELFAVPPKAGIEGSGGMAFTKDFGLPGTVYSRNITPAGIGNWTDAELYHTITTGVDKKGEPLFPIMPYTHYGVADPEDIKAIIAYIRTLKPVENTVPAQAIDFPMSLIMRTIPTEAKPGKRPAETDTIAYGQYMVNLAGCADCHTPMDKGQPVAGMDFAGGHEYKIDGIGTVRAANITPDNETGIGNWTQDIFIAAFKYYDNPDHRHIPWKQKGYQTVMPWMGFCGMKENDLAAIYKYLRTQKPVNHKVVKFSPEAEVASAQ